MNYFRNPARRSFTIAAASLAVLFAFTENSRAQSPWNVTITPNSNPLQVGSCTPVRLDLLDASGKDSPRNPAGGRISIADFDMSVSAGGAVVGRYDGASAFSACACPASAGSTATITATYPAKSLADRNRAPGVAFQQSIAVPVVAGNSSGVPIGCEAIKATTVPVAGSTAPWMVSVTSGVSALAIGSCTPFRIDLRDASGKESPRNPAGQLISLADFDMTVTSASGGAVAGQYDGASSWTACGCQGAAEGTQATITATYPARSTADRARVPGIAFQSSVTIPLSAARGTSNPPSCTAAATRITAAPQPAPAVVTLSPPVIVATAPPVATAIPAPRASAPSITTAPAILAGPVPTGITVTGTPASATLAWQPMTGLSSFVVKRQQAGAPTTQQTLASSNTGMFDGPLEPATAYTYTVTAIQSDGRQGSTDIAFTTPPAVNPGGFTAAQTGDGKVDLAWQPVRGATYYVVLGPGSSNGGVRVNGATTYTVTGAPLGAQEWLVASYYEPGPVSTVASAFTRAQVTVNTVLSGWVDLHTHPLVNLAFGGKLIHGGVDVGSLLPADTSCNTRVRATSIAQALSDDRPSHGGYDLFNFPCGDEFRKFMIHEFQQANEALVTNSPAGGFPDFDQWPKWNDLTHQKMWYEWIQRARDGGLRVMVALATNNKTLGDAVSGPGDGPTDDKTSADLQLTEIKAFVGRHNDFMEMAYGAADVKRIVQANKIAVVLGVEVDNIGNFNTQPIAALPLAAAQILITNEIQRLYDSGVRYIFPVHVMDNLFGGTAIYKDDFNTANFRESGHFWNIECADVVDNINHKYVEGSDVLRDVGAFVKIGLDPTRRSGPGPICPPAVAMQPPKSSGHRNALGLTQYGVIAVKEMMKRGMIVDIDHMGEKTANATLDIAESFGYPVVSGHSGIRGVAGADAENSRTPAQLARISKLHGMFGLGTDGIHSTAWARFYQQAMLDMGYLNSDPSKANYRSGAIAFGTDLNGLVKGPMPGGGNRVVYSATAIMSTNFDAPIPMSKTGTKSWNYNTEGVAHYGMLADFVRDIRTAPSNGYIGTGGVQLGVNGINLVDDHLFRSADYFWHMWEQIESKKSAVK